MMKYTVLRLMAVGLLALLAQACSDGEAPTEVSNNTGEVSPQPFDIRDQLTVYKTPSCGCCGDWVTHVMDSGFNADVVNQDTVAHVKDRFDIPSNARSCHTAVTDSGYVFEGHVPAKYMQAFLSDPPQQAVGLLVPAMPLGSPGMEVDDRFQPYRILQLNKDGTMEIFASVTSYAQQFN